MPAELAALAAALLVQVGALGLYATVANLELGHRVTLSPRDGALPDFSPLLGRLKRCTTNGFEGLTLFAPAVALVALTGTASPVTAFAAWVHVALRVLYIPAYAYGWVPARSIIWGLGLFATLTLIGATLVRAFTLA